MSFSKKLKKLREKPKHVKDRILVFCMVVAFVLVLAVWFLTFDFSGFNLNGVGTYVQDTKNYFSSSSQIFDSNAQNNITSQFAATTTQAN